MYKLREARHGVVNCNRYSELINVNVFRLLVIY